MSSPYQEADFTMLEIPAWAAPLLLGGRATGYVLTENLEDLFDRVDREEAWFRLVDDICGHLLRCSALALDRARALEDTTLARSSEQDLIRIYAIYTSMAVRLGSKLYDESKTRIIGAATTALNLLKTWEVHDDEFDDKQQAMMTVFLALMTDAPSYARVWTTSVQQSCIAFIQMIEDAYGAGIPKGLQICTAVQAPSSGEQHILRQLANRAAHASRDDSQGAELLKERLTLYGQNLPAAAYLLGYLAHVSENTGV